MAQNQVNVSIAQVQNISIAQPTVSLALTRAQHYVFGSASARQTNHISIGSTTSYQVSVRAQQRFLSFNGSSSTIPVNSIAVQTIAGSDLTGNGSPVSSETQIIPSVALSEIEMVFISHAPPEGGRGYHITYVISAANAIYYLNQVAGVYTTSVIYSLSPQ